VYQLFTVDQAAFSRALSKLLIDSDHAADERLLATVDASRALCALLVETRPAEVASLFADDGELWRAFFKDNDARIRAFFGHFHFDGRHELGARPLEKYLMERRDEYWSNLRWLGKRGVPPWIAARNPQHYLVCVVVRRSIRVMWSKNRILTSSMPSESC
jgi:hypothetical protein